MRAPEHSTTPTGSGTAVSWPLSLRLGQLACMLNFELADHPVYDGGELQWFDDEVHGTGMLAFLSRRDDRTVDYYQQPGLHLDRDGYHIGGGTRSWTDTTFQTARLDVADDGVRAEVRFRDVDGRQIEVLVDDRDGRRRRRAGLLAPVSGGIEHPSSMLLVWMPGFDLVHVTDTPPVVRVDGTGVATGRLPGGRLHRRHLVKYAAPVLTVELNRAHVGPLWRVSTGERAEVDADGRLRSLTAEQDAHLARVVLEPGLPQLGTLPDDVVERGRWHIDVDGTRLTGGSWSATRTTSGVHLTMDPDERWRPQHLPWLMRVVTTVVPVFRRWPTTYRWRCHLRQDGEAASITSGWQRTASHGADSYRRATGS